jgi:hypothetical protein
MLSLAVIGLSLAACAEAGEAMAASLAEQAAEIAATQAVTATTQAVAQLQSAATQMSAASTAQPVNLPNLPPVGKGNLIIASPNYIIVQTGGKRFIFVKSSPPTDDEADH